MQKVENTNFPYPLQTRIQHIPAQERNNRATKMIDAIEARGSFPESEDMKVVTKKMV